MKVIGITGGVGAGKSSLLKIIKDNYSAHIILADEVAHRIMEPGKEAYHPLITLLGPEILKDDGFIDKRIMAQRIFNQDTLREQVNGIIHPAVKRVIIKEIEEQRQRKEVDFLFVEAALLIEDHYDVICDELWYIYAGEEVRRKRLKESRNYSEEKIQNILDSQLKEQEFINKCKVVIDNSEDMGKAFQQIERELGGNRSCRR